MGMFKKKIKVINMNNSDLFFEHDFWVDTGALYSFVPEDLLEKIQVEPADTRNLILADGRTSKNLLGIEESWNHGIFSNLTLLNSRMILSRISNMQAIKFGSLLSRVEPSCAF